MKRPVEMVKEIIEKSSFPVDDIFLDSIPQEELNETINTQILLSESRNAPDTYGNSDFVTIKYGVYIQIFYTNEDTDIDIVNSEIELMKFLIKNNWTIYQSNKHYLDPDTEQMIKNITVQRTMTLSEIANS